jgi:hypothetical protein
VPCGNLGVKKQYGKGWEEARTGRSTYEERAVHSRQLKCEQVQEIGQNPNLGSWGSEGRVKLKIR